MKFDAYLATIREAEFPLVIDVLESGLSGIANRDKPRGRLVEVINIDVDNRVACSVGVDRASGAVFVEGKGDTSPRLAKLLRVHFPGHSVARVDTCEDFSEPGAFEAIQAIMRRAKEPRVYSGYVCLSDRPEDGRTWQCGKPSGVVMSRLYEKGKQPECVGLVPPDLVRLEFQIRPQYAVGKVAASRFDPVEVLGFSRWSKKCGEAVLATAIPRYEMAIRKNSLSAALTYVGRAHRRSLEVAYEDGVDLQRMWREQWEEDDRIKAMNGGFSRLMPKA